MQIICPNCGSKSPIEAGSLVTQTRIVCADCAVEFAAILSDEQSGATPAAERGIELFQASEVSAGVAHEITEESAVEAAPEVSEKIAAEVAAEIDAPAASGDVYEVLTLPEETLLPHEEAAAAGHPAGDHSNVLEDVFAAPARAREESEVGRDAAEAGDEPTVLCEDQEAEAVRAERGWDEGGVENVGDAVEAAGDEYVPLPVAFAGERLLPPAAAMQSVDKYALGTRLMRVSPLWLLVSGLSFISFVVFCNWFFVPANLAQADTPRPASLRNQATNQSLASAATALDVAPSRPDAQNSSRPAPQQDEADTEVVEASSKVELPTPAPTQWPAPTAEPAAPARAEQPKQAETAAQAQPAAAGKFTLQVGSYNVPSEAEARAASLKAAGQAARVVEVEIPKRGKWYRVYVGGFGSRDEAELHGRELRGKGLAASYIATEAR